MSHKSALWIHISNNRIVPGKSLDERPRPPRDNMQLSLVFAAEAVASCIERGQKDGTWPTIWFIVRLLTLAMLKCLRSLICPRQRLVPAPPVREFPSGDDDSLAQLPGQASSRQVRGYSTPEVTDLATLIPSVGSMPTAASTAA